VVTVCSNYKAIRSSILLNLRPRDPPKFVASHHERRTRIENLLAQASSMSASSKHLKIYFLAKISRSSFRFIL